jgi:hypothetical protein
MSHWRELDAPGRRGRGARRWVAGVQVDPLVGGLRHTSGIIVLVALARERRLVTVCMPAIDARGDVARRLSDAAKGSLERRRDQPVQ